MNKTTVIYHRADFDGLFSAAVCKKFLPDDTKFIGWDFGDPLIPFPGEGTLCIVDLSPDCLSDAIMAVAAHHDRLVWIDHHKSSIDKWNPAIPGYRIDGVAACRLCWQWLTAPKHASCPTFDDYKNREVVEPLALTLAGEYDVWDKRDERADAFQFGMWASGVAEGGCIVLLDNEKEVLEYCEEGFAMMRLQRQFAASTCRERSYIREWEGQTFCVLGSAHTRNSMWFPQEAIPKECDALMCWRYDGNRVSFSLYHAPGHEEHDLSPIAVKYGGGGHRGACGFSMSLEDAMKVIK